MANLCDIGHTAAGNQMTPIGCPLNRTSRASTAKTSDSLVCHCFHERGGAVCTRVSTIVKTLYPTLQTLASSKASVENSQSLQDTNPRIEAQARAWIFVGVEVHGWA